MLFDKQEFDSASRETEDSGIAWNLGTKLNFLRKKPYPFSVYFNRSHPVVFRGRSAGSYTQKDTSFGLDFALLQPFSPVNVNASLFRSINEGDSRDYLAEQTHDSLLLSLSGAFLGEEITSLTYSLTRTENREGDPRLPIQSIEVYLQDVIFLNRWTLGDRNQFRLTNDAQYNRSDTPGRDYFWYRPRLDWSHTENMASNYDYKFTRNTRENDTDGDDLTSTNHEGKARLRLTLSDNLSVNGGAFASLFDADTFNSQVYGAHAGAHYHRPIPIGNFSVTNSLRYSFNEQESTPDNQGIVDETHTLPGRGFSNRVPLDNDFVVAGSVVVTNATVPFKPCTEGKEYALHVVGRQTQIELLDASDGCFVGTGSDPLSGDEPEDILVDYAFESSGSLSFSTLSTSINANLNIWRYYNLYASFSDSRQSEQDSTRIFSIQPRSFGSVQLAEVGAKADVPLWKSIRVSGEARYSRNKQEDVTSDSMRLFASASIPLPFFHSSAGIHASKYMTDFSDNSEGSDSISYGASINSNPWGRLGLSLDAFHNEDTGSSIKTSNNEANFRVTWQMRKLRVSATAKYRNDVRGEDEQDRLEAWLLIRRDIW
jgi:hypothetical protein